MVLPYCQRPCFRHLHRLYSLRLDNKSSSQKADHSLVKKAIFNPLQEAFNSVAQHLGLQQLVSPLQVAFQVFRQVALTIHLYSSYRNASRCQSFVIERRGIVTGERWTARGNESSLSIGLFFSPCASYPLAKKSLISANNECRHFKKSTRSEKIQNLVSPNAAKEKRSCLVHLMLHHCQLPRPVLAGRDKKVHFSTGRQVMPWTCICCHVAIVHCSWTRSVNEI